MSSARFFGVKEILCSVGPCLPCLPHEVAVIPRTSRGESYSTGVSDVALLCEPALNVADELPRYESHRLM